jgi:G:T/U-mismatch repair DNA glycosylase
VPDVIAPGLRVLFCGINPGLYTAAVGHHFARPGNRFWPALFAAGFTERLVSPFAERELLESGYGITNVVMRASATADELTREELRAGGKNLIAKVKRYKPAFLAVLAVIFIGMSATVLKMAQGHGPDIAMGESKSTSERILSVISPSILGILIIILGIYIPPIVSNVLHDAAGVLGGE